MTLRMHFRPLLLAFGLALGSIAGAATAGTVAGTGGSTEITQLLNNLELVKATASDVNTVRNTLQSAMYLKQTLQQLDPSTIARLTGIPVAQVQDMARLNDELGTAFDAANQVAGVLSNVVQGSQAANMTPTQFVTQMAMRAKQMGGAYQQNYDANRAQMKALQDSLNAIQTTSAQIPGVTSQVDGLQQLLSQNVQTQATLVSMNQAIVRANAMADLKGMDETYKVQTDAASAAAHQAAMQSLQNVNVSLPDPTKYAPTQQ